MPKNNRMTKAAALRTYNALPVTATPCQFIKGGQGNWGLTEKEYKRALRLAKIACAKSKPRKRR